MLRKGIWTRLRLFWGVVLQKVQVMSVSNIKQQFKAFSDYRKIRVLDNMVWHHREPQDYPDRRAWARRMYEATVVTTICEMELDSAVSHDRELSCQALDASSQGLRLACSLEMPVGAVLDFVVHDAAKRTAFTLTGEVRWVSREGGPNLVAKAGYQAGISLYDWYETDIRQWQKLFVI